MTRQHSTAHSNSARAWSRARHMPHNTTSGISVEHFSFCVGSSSTCNNGRHWGIWLLWPTQPCNTTRYKIKMLHPAQQILETPVTWHMHSSLKSSGCSVFWFQSVEVNELIWEDCSCDDCKGTHPRFSHPLAFFLHQQVRTLWAGLEMWNVFSYILMVTPKVSSKRSPCSRDILKRIGLITYWKFWSSTEGSYLVSGICPSKSSRVNSFCTNSSTFLMSEVLKLSTVSEVARLLSFALLQTLPHLFMRYQGHRSGGFL